VEAGKFQCAVTAPRQLTAGGRSRERRTGEIDRRKLCLPHRLNNNISGANRASIMGRGNLNMRMILAATLAIVPMMAKDHDNAKRLDEAATVFSEIMATPDKGIPRDLMENARCVVIVPNLKTAAFFFGAKYGKGYVSCRKKGGIGWSAPGTIRIEGGSVGFQIGGEETDLIMLVMNQGGEEKLLSDKFTLGGEGSIAGGPVGRTATAQTDLQMHAEILSWSRSQGLFAGLALEGATLRPDLDDNAAIYGKRLSNKEILTTRVRVPRAAARLVTELDKYSAREHKAIPTGAGQ
jgi:lipid-binding SYLF domain-containing protein